ncbi:hypothetical protein [Brytella acorum]|uniref:Uncharacterized protein n=1 Tax=Brytella acorum TaxID=2959299 RepID=A0AA35V983_9PROT|nr:hypothetical protein [Brytella acorum]MDF3625249.1 hypothetical protein [Brytella acorum]CAI9119339.1 hypothetical protein LMG32879_000152 [Brytella acorum]
MADANTLLTGLVTLIEEAAGNAMSTDAKAKIALYTGILGSAMNAILPEINGRIDWATLETALATGLSGIDTAYKGVETAIAQAKTSETITNG